MKSMYYPGHWIESSMIISVNADRVFAKYCTVYTYNTQTVII